MVENGACSAFSDIFFVKGCLNSASGVATHLVLCHIPDYVACSAITDVKMVNNLIDRSFGGIVNDSVADNLVDDVAFWVISDKTHIHLKENAPGIISF